MRAYWKSKCYKIMFLLILVVVIISFREQPKTRRKAKHPIAANAKALHRACQLPELNPFAQEILRYISTGKVSKIFCPKEYFSSVRNGHLYLKLNGVSNAYYEYIRRPVNNDNRVQYGEKTMIPIPSGGLVDFQLKLSEDFVRVTFTKDNKRYEEFHAGIVEKNDVFKRAKLTKIEAKLPYNIALLMVDSQSASHWKRRMPKIYSYLKNDKNTFIFDGHTIVGDGTTAQLSAILAGGFECDFGESRRGYRGAEPVDKWPFIFKDFIQRGYATMFNEDDPWFGAFSYRLLGFEKPPTDHYSRVFWLNAKIQKNKTRACHGNNPIFVTSLNYLRDFHEKYKVLPKFSMTFLSTMFHNNMETLYSLEDPLLSFLKEMKAAGHLADTVLVLLSDHGARYGNFRETLTGKLEERLPFLSITMPSKLLEKQPQFKTAMRHNTKVLTSHFDLHATLKHFFTYPYHPKVTIGQSLFTVIDETTRVCESAGVKEHWCPCLESTELNTTDPEVIAVARSFIQFVNREFLWKNPEAFRKCERLALKDIHRAATSMPRKAVQEFRETAKTAKSDEGKVVFGKGVNLLKSYQLVLSAFPSNATFEVSLKTKENKIFDEPIISRINKYGDQPKCLQDKYPMLRKYCYCKHGSLA
ncbi:uncharacterized protein LOC135690486 [Rhopilema esculentum]|uniref:uncharacterized protein LOC135690486 n=1 Tax=Rhopilema esculentum TaxID=499914 RepID=UPI0031CE2F2B|eukprot:gene1089-15423_t